MNRKQQANLVTGLAIVAIAGLVVAWAKSDPKCNRGCQDNLDHFFNHVLDDVITGSLPR